MRDERWKVTKNTNNLVFSDLPGIIMPSLGIAMIGLMTAISAYH